MKHSTMFIVLLLHSGQLDRVFTMFIVVLIAFQPEPWNFKVHVVTDGFKNQDHVVSDTLLCLGLCLCQYQVSTATA